MMEHHDTAVFISVGVALFASTIGAAIAIFAALLATRTVRRNRARL